MPTHAENDDSIETATMAMTPPMNRMLLARTPGILEHQREHKSAGGAMIAVHGPDLDQEVAMTPRKLKFLPTPYYALGLPLR